MLPGRDWGKSNWITRSVREEIFIDFGFISSSFSGPSINWNLRFSKLVGSAMGSENLIVSF